MAHKDEHKGPQGKDKKLTLIIIVNGTAAEVEANLNQKLHVVAQKALEQTGNTGRKLEDWILKEVSGRLLDLDQTIESYGLVDRTELVLSLSAGVGG